MISISYHITLILTIFIYLVLGNCIEKIYTILTNIDSITENPIGRIVVITWSWLTAYGILTLIKNIVW